jgi:putative endonuclease
MKTYYIYILSNKTGTLYTGMTSNLERRIYEHKNGLIDGFTKKYSISRLIYFEETSDVQTALAREKQIKKWGRAKKLDLVRSVNPEFEDLSENWL